MATYRGFLNTYMLYDNKSDHDLSSIYCKILCESTSDKNEKLLTLAKRIERSFYSDKAKEAEFGREAEELGYSSVKQLMHDYDLYKRYFIKTEPEYPSFSSQSPKSNSIDRVYNDISQYEDELKAQGIQDHTNTPHNLSDLKTGTYYLTNYRQINSVLNLLQQTKYIFTFEDVEGDTIVPDMKCLRPHSINNRGKYRFAQFIRKMAPDKQIDDTIAFIPTRIINREGPDFDINPNEIESIDIHNGKVDIKAKVPIDLYCR